MASISHLLAFLEAATCGSFIEASANLQLSESAVSARIKALESTLDARLFSRSKHGVVLNDAGRAFLPFAETVVAAWQRAQGAVTATSKGNTPIAVGIQQDLWEIFAANWFADIAKFTPDVELSVICDYTDILCGGVAQEKLDLALIFEPKRSRGVSLEALTRMPLVLVSDRAMKWSGQLPEGYCFVDWGDAFSSWHEEKFQSQHPGPLSVSVSGMALSAILNNGGAAYVLEESVSRHVVAGQIHLVENAPTTQIGVFLVRSEKGAIAGTPDFEMGVRLLKNLVTDQASKLIQSS